MARSTSTNSHRSTMIVGALAVLLLLWIEGVDVFGLVGTIMELVVMAAGIVLLTVAARRVMGATSRRR